MRKRLREFGLHAALLDIAAYCDTRATQHRIHGSVEIDKFAEQWDYAAAEAREFARKVFMRLPDEVRK